MLSKAMCKNLNIEYEKPNILVRDKLNKKLEKSIKDLGFNIINYDCINNKTYSKIMGNINIYLDIKGNIDIVVEALENNILFIALKTEEIFNELKGTSYYGKLTCDSSNASFEENILYHINRYLKGELQMEILNK
jgi:hypothetical protein